MTEVARALVLPHVMVIEVHRLLSLLLVWDSVELTTIGRYEKDDSPEGEAFRELTAEGLVRRPESQGLPESADEAIEDWVSAGWDFVADHPDPDFPSALAKRMVEQVLDEWVDDVRAAVEAAGQRGLATVALHAFEAQAAALPQLDPSAPVAESALIQAASRGVAVGPDISVEDVLAFREKNSALMGKYRAALIDLAGAIQNDSPIAAAEEARAVVANRVEPALANLEEALDESRIRYAWSTLIGASAVVMGGPVTPAVAATGAGSVVAKRLQYAFNRDRLVRDHPFGLLHRAASEIGRRTDSPAPITDPEAELKQELVPLIDDSIRAAVRLTELRARGT